MERNKALALAAIGAFIIGISTGFLVLVFAPMTYMFSAIARLLLLLGFIYGLIIVLTYPFETLALIFIVMRALYRKIFAGKKGR